MGRSDVGFAHAIGRTRVLDGINSNGETQKA